MSRELINLLPEDRERAFRREYFLRLATTGVWLLAAVALVHGLLLLPAYVGVASLVREKTAQLSGAELGNLDSTTSRLIRVAQEATALGHLSQVRTGSTLTRSVLEVPRPGVTLSRIAYAEATQGRSATYAIAGVATDRESLRNYNLALSHLSVVASADLPISAYAKESNIDFVITLTLTP